MFRCTQSSFLRRLLPRKSIIPVQFVCTRSRGPRGPPQDSPDRSPSWGRHGRRYEITVKLSRRNSCSGELIRTFFPFLPRLGTTTLARNRKCEPVCLVAFNFSATFEPGQTLSTNFKSPLPLWFRLSRRRHLVRGSISTPLFNYLFIQTTGRPQPQKKNSPAEYAQRQTLLLLL